MPAEPIIRASGLNKAFKLPHERHGSIKSLFVSRFRTSRTFERQQVLKDISFEIQKGEFFGIVGRNGSGKSTLLKLLAGIYSPDSGGIAVDGKLIPFIELGVGFNPELTGRENVFLNGALLGFSQGEVEKMYDDIVEFAELDRFMDQKLKNYSSGMQVRLAFSIAIRAKGDILLLDEVLAVGDEAFQQKCVDVFEKYKANKQTVILVTHDMESVKKFCSRAMLINDGEIVEIGNPRVVAERYSKLNMDKIENNMLAANTAGRENNHLGLEIEYRNQSNKKSSLFKCGDLINILTTYDKRDDFQHIVINIYKQSGEHVTGFRVPADSGESLVKVKALFSKGKYYTVIQAVSGAAAVGSVIVGPDFAITTDTAPGVEGWSGLVPVDYKVIKT